MCFGQEIILNGVSGTATGVIANISTRIALVLPPIGGATV